MSWMLDLRQSWRALLRSPGFSGVAILTLALGIGATSAIFSILNAVALRPLPFGDPEQLVFLWSANPANDIDQNLVSMADYLDWREQAESFDGLSVMQYTGLVLVEDGEPEEITTALVSPQLFSVLRSRPTIGRAFLEEEEIPGNDTRILLSHGLWQRRFGADPEVVGRDVILSGQEHTVVGVMPPEFQFPSADVEMWSPMAFYRDRLRRGGRILQIVGRLRDGVSLDQAQRELDTITARLAEKHPATNAGWTARVVSMHEQLFARNRRDLLLLLAAVAVVLCIAAANVAGLMMARATSQQPQVAVRAALGAGRLARARQPALEGLLIAVLGGVGGLILAHWFVRAIVASIPWSVQRIQEAEVDGSVILFALGVTLVLGLFIASIPALRSLRVRSDGALGTASARGASPSRSMHRFGKLLVIGELALALVVLIGAGLLARSYQRLNDVDPGFVRDNLLVLQLHLPPTKSPWGNQQMTFFETLFERAAALPGAISAGATSTLPLSRIGMDLDLPVTVLGGVPVTPGTEPRASLRVVNPTFFRTLGMPLLQGRGFEDRDRIDAPRVLVINQTLAKRLWPDSNPIGERLSLPFRGIHAGEVVGVVGDVRHYGLERGARPEVYLPFAQAPLLGMSIIIRTEDDPMRLVEPFEAELWALDPQQPLLRATLMEELVARSLDDSRSNAVLLTIFAAVAVTLAAMGIYGLVAYGVRQRTREIGVRMAFGARDRDVVGAMVGLGTRSVAVGVALGLVSALVLTRVIEGFLFGVAAIDPLTFLAAPVLLGGVALLGSYLPARRATRVQPIEVLRYE